MDKEEYQEIDSTILKKINGNAWSIENMEGHEAGEREVTYIGSRANGYLDNDSQKGQLIFDYYRDSMGQYWFRNRALLPSGAIVSMDMYVFGRETKHTSCIRKKN